MNVYENILLTKKRINSKKWDLSERLYTTTPMTLDASEQESEKVQLVIYKFENAESIEEVKNFNKTHEFIVMSPLGANKPIKTYDLKELYELSAKATLCSVTGKKVIVAHCK